MASDINGSDNEDSDINGTVVDTDDVPHDNRVMVPVYKDSRLEPVYQLYPFSDVSCSVGSSTTKLSTEDGKDWKTLATERGTEITQLEFRIDVMQKVIRQYERKCDRIKRTAEAATKRADGLSKLGESYMERGLSFDKIDSDPEDHDEQNVCTYMK